MAATKIVRVNFFAGGNTRTLQTIDVYVQGHPDSKKVKNAVRRALHMPDNVTIGISSQRTICNHVH